jgi:DNA-binding NarL/FixJ family response regulator
MLKILIADDHAIVRRGLMQVLSDERDLEVSEAVTPHEVARLVREQSWDVVVLDLDMPGKNGLDLLKEIKAEHPKLPILILSMHPEDQFAVRSLRAGAAGYLTKASAPDDLVKAIRKISKGGRHITEAVADKLAFNLNEKAEKPPHESLSDREYQVLCLIASGKTVGEIAPELSLSVPTVSTYRTRILEKMGMRTNAELTHYAIRQGLVK